MNSISTSEYSREFANALAHYERFSDEALAVVVAGDASERTEDASRALQCELERRDRVAVESRAIAIRELKAIDLRRIRDNDFAPPDSPEKKSERSSAYAKVVRVARWIAFIPAAWQVTFLQLVLMGILGLNDQERMMSAPSDYFIPVAVTACLSSLAAFLVGLWVCPARNKIIPAVVLVAVMIFHRLYVLWTISHLPLPSSFQRLNAVSFVVFMATLVMALGVMALRPKRTVMPLLRTK